MLSFPPCTPHWRGQVKRVPKTTYLVLHAHHPNTPSPFPSPPLPPTQGSQILQCYNAHNSYLFAIQAYNSRCETQYKTTFPELLDVSGAWWVGVVEVWLSGTVGLWLRVWQWERQASCQSAMCSASDVIIALS